MSNLIAFFLIALSTTCLSGEEIVISAGSWPPHISSDLADYGSSAKIVTAAFASEGVEVKYQFLPWKRAFLTSLKGLSNGTILWARTPEREKNFYMSDPVKVYQWVFFHLKDYTFDWKELTDLNGIMIGAVIGFLYSEEFDSAAKSNKISVHYVVNNKQNIEKILAKRIHLLPMEKESGYYLLKKTLSPETASRFTHHPTPLKEQSLHLLLSRKFKDNKRMLDIFNRGLKKYKKSIID